MRWLVGLESCCITWEQYQRLSSWAKDLPEYFNLSRAILALLENLGRSAGMAAS